MSRRTAEANKAVATAWVNEKKLVSEGKGTRDWTPDQQNDILKKGKAYDDSGKAFQGHHMKSVEMYPEYQGNSENIQFLSRKEHTDAHGGSFQNPTNGFYDYLTGETTNFEMNKPVPCEIIKLSNPIVTISKDALSYKGDNRELDELQAKTALSDREQTEHRPYSQAIEELNKPTNANQSSVPKTSERQSWPKRAWGKVKHGGKWIAHHPLKALGIAGGFVLSTAILAGKAANIIDKLFSPFSSHSDISGSDGSSGEGYGGFDSIIDNSSGDGADSDYVDEVDKDGEDEKGAGAEKSPHLRHGHISHVWTGPRGGEQIRKEVWIEDTPVKGWVPDDSEDDDDD